MRLQELKLLLLAKMETLCPATPSNSISPIDPAELIDTVCVLLGVIRPVNPMLDALYAPNGT